MVLDSCYCTTKVTPLAQRPCLWTVDFLYSRIEDPRLDPIPSSTVTCRDNCCTAASSEIADTVYLKGYKSERFCSATKFLVLSIKVSTPSCKDSGTVEKNDGKSQNPADVDVRCSEREFPTVDEKWGPCPRL